MTGHPDLPAPRSTALTAPAPGTIFAGHRIEARIGRGGMGVVYRARHCRLGRTVALKVIAPELLEDASAHERFLEEAVVAAALEHPNVVPVHDAGESGGIAYLAMKYVHGTDLCGAGPLDPVRAAEIVAEVGDALDAMHRAGYVHRDVKPRNVLIARGGHAYLSDFGLARRVTSRCGATRAGHWVGTADYVAPEQIRGRPADARADVYGLGCLLFFALTGRPPYARENLEARLWAHLHEPPPAPSRLCPGIPSAMDGLVARALAKEPADRFASAGELGRCAVRAADGACRSGRIAQPRREIAGAALTEASTVSRQRTVQRGPRAGLTRGAVAVT